MEAKPPTPSLAQVAYTLVSFCFMLGYALAVGYLLVLGYPIMGYPYGGDTPNHLTGVVYIEKYWPNVPQWFYEWGCGYPFMWAYSPASFYLCFFVHEFLFLSIFDAYKILGFASVVFAAFGIYLLMKIKFRNEFGALAAAILYLSTPASWNFLSYWGFFPLAAAVPFFIFTLVFFELYQMRGKKRYFIPTVACYSIFILSHITTGFIGTLIFIAYAIASAHFSGVAFKRVLANLFKVLIVGVGLSAFYLVRFIQILQVTQVGVLPPHDLVYNSLSFEDLLGFGGCLLYTSPSPRDRQKSRMPSSA